MATFSHFAIAGGVEIFGISKYLISLVCAKLAFHFSQHEPFHKLAGSARFVINSS
jgi:hypothetical protein